MTRLLVSQIEAARTLLQRVVLHPGPVHSTRTHEAGASQHGGVPHTCGGMRLGAADHGMQADRVHDGLAALLRTDVHVRLHVGAVIPDAGLQAVYDMLHDLVQSFPAGRRQALVEQTAPG